jgi:hypothetical protein
MVFDPYSLKSEALLLFCRDLLNSYNNSEKSVFSVDKRLELLIQKHTDNIIKGINTILQSNEYYLRNIKVSRIKMILHYYETINQSINKSLKKDSYFDPCMLSFAMLATWFKEYGFEKKAKEFILFSIYPYGEIYDGLLVKNVNEKYKKLNIEMVKLSEKMMDNLYKTK